MGLDGRMPPPLQVFSSGAFIMCHLAMVTLGVVGPTISPELGLSHLWSTTISTRTGWPRLTPRNVGNLGAPAPSRGCQTRCSVSLSGLRWSLPTAMPEQSVQTGPKFSNNNRHHSAS